MTDKQIIIDGCDVSGCSLYEDNPKYRMWGTCDCMRSMVDQSGYDELAGAECKGYNCYYKQLKRKEQELEQVNKAYEACKESRLKAYNILQEKEQECEQLKVRCKSLEDISGRLQKQNHELTLENEKLQQYKASKQAIYEALQKKCNELELEKRKLKERLDQWISKCEQETKLKEFHKNETDEYKNPLLYIKEIAEDQQSWNEWNRQFSETEFEDDIFAYNWSALKQILQKISEVIKDE